MTVVLLQRKARPGVNFSVESYFAAVREILSTEVAVRVHTCSCYSRGVSRRLWLVLEAWWRSRGDVLHVTGDVRFLTYLLSRRRTLLTVLDVGFLERKRGLRRALLKLFWLTLPCRCVSYITVISEATKRELLREVSFPEERIHVIPVFVSPRFRPARGVAPSTGDKPVLLQIGTKPNKNLERLIEAVAGLDCMLDIVGVLTGRQKELLARHKVDYRGASNLPADEIVERYQAGFSGGLQLLSRYRRCSPGT